jgi:type IV secretion system protein VirB9
MTASRPAPAWRPALALGLPLWITPFVLAEPPEAPLYEPGAAIEVIASPARLTDIMLEAGETLLSVAAGDTARWTLANALSGSGADQRPHVLIRPQEEDLTTNLLILTDRRAYHLELRSSANPGPAQIRWSYPPEPAAAPEPQGRDVEAADLNFGWKITGDAPSWRPVRVFDDGHRVFIERAEGAREAPPLMIIGPEGPELANYRVTDRHYIVDHLFETAEMRVGTRSPVIVRIRKDALK